MRLIRQLSALLSCLDAVKLIRHGWGDYLCLIREDSGLMVIQNKGGYPRQDGRAPSAALIKHY